MDSVKHAANYVSDTVKGTVSTNSKEAHKDVAKDPNADISTRLSAGKEAAGNKMDEQRHQTDADVHREAAKH